MAPFGFRSLNKQFSAFSLSGLSAQVFGASVYEIIVLECVWLSATLFTTQCCFPPLSIIMQDKTHCVYLVHT